MNYWAIIIGCVHQLKLYLLSIIYLCSLVVEFNSSATCMAKVKSDFVKCLMMWYIIDVVQLQVKKTSLAHQHGEDIERYDLKKQLSRNCVQ